MKHSSLNSFLLLTTLSILFQMSVMSADPNLATGTLETMNGDTEINGTDVGTIFIDDDIYAPQDLILKTNHIVVADGVTLKAGHNVILVAPFVEPLLLEVQGDLIIEAEGDITLEGAITATGDIALIADSDLQYGGDVTTNGAVTAGGNVDIAGNLIELNENVSANGGDLTIAGRTSKDNYPYLSEGGLDVEWGYIDVAEGKTLEAGHDVILTDAFGSGGDEEPPAGEMDLFGHGSLGIVAEGGSIQTQGPFGEGVKITVEDLSPTWLGMVQADPLNLADYSFGNQNNTDLYLESYNGSITAVDSSQPLSGKNENAADQWASIGATALTDITLQGHDIARDITAKALTSNATFPYTGNISVTSDNRKVLLTEDVIANNGSVTLTAIDPTNGGIVISGNIFASDGVILNEPGTGAIVRGTVYDASTADQPISGVIVSADGKETQTDINGEYEISGLSPGYVIVTVSKIGYQTQAQEIPFANPEVYTVDFELIPEGMVVIDSGFRPALNGFHFNNRGVLDVGGIPILGYCVGMSYAALNYWHYDILPNPSPDPGDPSVWPPPDDPQRKDIERLNWKTLDVSFQSILQVITGSVLPHGWIDENYETLTGSLWDFNPQPLALVVCNA